jgi:MinD-like ATPase involved in chromosome partitioning or flagellar assembly
MSTVVVTVVGPAGRRDLALPSEASVGELVPRLADLLNGDTRTAQNDWTLAPAAGSPLPLEASLAASGVLDGSVLYLAPRNTKPAGAADLSGPPTDDGLGPAERTAALLPAEPSKAHRLAAAARAFVGRRNAPSGEPGPGAIPTPAELTIVKPTARRRLAREAWRNEDYLEQLSARIAAPRLRRSVTIAVVSPKGGVGKTTTTVLLGTLLALVRRDRTVAVDTNPDFGSLGRSLAPSHDVFVDDLLELLDRPDLTLTSLDAHLARAPHGLMVLPAPTDPARMERLDETAYRRVIERLSEFVGVVLLDCGTGLQEPAARAALKASDQVVLVTDADPAAASLVAESALLLEREGRPMTLVVNKLPPKGSRLDLGSLARRLRSARALVVVPSEPAAASSLAAGELDWRDAPRSWQRATRELAAALVSDWPRLGLTLER